MKEPEGRTITLLGVTEKVSLSGSASSFVRGEPIKTYRKVPRKEIKIKNKKVKK